MGSTPMIGSTDFSPAAREGTQYWRGIPATVDESGVDPTEPAHLMRVRVPGKRSLQEVSEDDRKAKIEEAKARMNVDGGVVASTETTHQKYRRIFLDACKELGIPKGQQLEFGPEIFRELGAWCFGMRSMKIENVVHNMEL